jgi:hypothetical protein
MGAVPREANTLRTQDDTFGLFAGEMCGGAAVILPFDVESVLRDTRSADKSFYAGRERLPFERVSLVAKGEVRHLLHDALEFLCHARGFPYVHLWYYPAGHRNVFAFRIDSDGADRNDIDDLYALVRSNSIGASWYLDVKSHEPWLDHFGSMVGQEFGVHCYEHRVYDTYELNLENIRRARRAMEFAGLAPQGFAAPFGTWNHHVARAVDDAGFIYSSEFSLAYDTLPLYPIADSTTYSALQVPVHPISPGVLRRAGYSEQQMTDYFAAVIDHKRVRAEPLFFYHHPSHRSWKAMEALFRIVAEGGVEATTLGDFARWWMRRLRYRVEFKFDRSAVLPVVSGKGGGADDVWLHISRPDGQEAFSPPAPRLDLAELRWSAPAPAPPPADLRRIRDFDPRTLLAELYATMTRRLR